MKISIIIIGQKIDFSAKTRRNQEDEKKLGLTDSINLLSWGLPESRLAQQWNHRRIPT